MALSPIASTTSLTAAFLLPSLPLTTRATRTNQRAYPYPRRTSPTKLESLTSDSLIFLSDFSQNDYSPLLLSSLAGASTCLGASVVFFVEPSLAEEESSNSQSPLDPFLSFSLSLAAAVMITVSVLSLIPECLSGIVQVSPVEGILVISDTFLLQQRILSFLAGCLFYFGLSLILMKLPEPDSFLSKTNHANEVSYHDATFITGFEREHVRGNATAIPWTNTDRYLPATTKTSSNISAHPGSWRVAMLIFFSLLCHNFPEGLAVAASTVESTNLGLVVAFGIMMHNIPEGLAIAIPCLAARPTEPWLAFTLASASGLAEPIGALFALKMLHVGNGGTIALENVLAGVAGIMCMVSIRDLYPEAIRYANNEDSDKSIFRQMVPMGTLCGVVAMALTELALPH